MPKVRLLILFLLGAAALFAADDISGTWSASVTITAGSGSATFNFKQTGEALSGTYNGVLGDAKVTGAVKGNEVTWSFENDQAGKIVYKGTLEGASKMKGSVEYGALGSGTFTADKK
jgi:hypothetical protein